MEAINWNLSAHNQFDYLYYQKPVSILIVEDDVTLRPLMEYIVHKAHPNSTLLWAYTEEEAEFAIRDKAEKGEKFQFIIADIFLSGPRTGVDLWRRYANTGALFILMSSITPAKLVKMLSDKSEENPNSLPIYLKKPLSPEECIETLRVAF